MDQDVPDFALEAAEELEKEAEAASAEAASNERLIELATTMASLKEKLDELDEYRKKLQESYDRVRKVDIPEMMRNLKMVTGNKGSFTIEGGKIHLETRVFAGYDKSHEDEFFEWLESNNLGSIIKRTVNAQTLSATVRDLREQGVEDVPHLNVYEETTAKFVRSRK